MVWRWHERLSNDAAGLVFAPAGREDQGTASVADQTIYEFTSAARALRRKTHQTIARVTSDFEGLHLNTIVAALMELFNQLIDFNADPATASDADAFAVREALESLALMLAPFSPHVSEEMWEAFGHEGGLLSSACWPRADAELARSEQLEIPIQVNGKLRSRLLASPRVTEDELRRAALSDQKVQAFIEGHEVVKVIVVPQRLVNVVVR
jgi:leucyl-tRNA synthetase